MSADSGLHDPPLPRVPVHAYRPNDVPVSLTTPGPPLPSASTTPCASSGIGTEAALPARPSARVGKVTPVSQRTASSDSPGPSGRFSASTSALSLSGQDINSVTALRARCEALSDEIAVLKQDQALVNQDAAARCGSLEQQVDVLIKERVASDGVRTQLVKEVIALKTRVQELTQLLDKSASDAESMAVDDARDDPISSNSSPSSILNAPSDHNRGDISFSELPSRAHGTVHPDYAVACEIHAFTTSHHAGYDQVSDGAGSGQGTPTSVDVGLFYAPVFVTEVESIPAPASSTTSSQQTLASDATGACPPRWQPQPIGSPRWLAPRTSPARYGRSRQLARRLSGPDEFERNRLVMLELLRRYAPGAMEAPFLAFVNECCVDHYSDLADIGDRMVRQHRRVAELTDLVYQLEAKLLVEKERSVAIADRLLFSNQALRRARRNQDPRPGERPEPADHEARIDYAEGECTRLESELELQKDITRICFSRLYRLSLIVMERGLDQLEQGFVVPLLPEGAGLRPNVVQATAGRLIGAPGVQARSARAYTEFVTGGRSDNDTRLDNDRAKQSLSFEACAWDIDDTDGIYERLDECPSPPAHIGSLCHADAIDDYYSDLMKRSAERRLNEPLFDPSTFGALGLDLGTVRASP
ncbi:hypothetical protein OC835_000789 [Tilletia horrida]|nr:hypothetical protein OC835_000789 [Tilletia horrida]